MIVLELAAQGVRGVAPAGGRAMLRPGYNVLSAEGPSLRRLLEALLYPDGRDAEAVPRISAAPGSPGIRAGLTVVGNDNVTYRLVRDFAAGSQLHKFDPAKKVFSPVSTDLAAIAKLLREQVGVPPRAQQESVLFLSASEKTFLAG